MKLMRLVLLVFSVAAFSVSFASAQALPQSLPIHGHPQLAAYTDLSQEPWTSAQAHWSASGATVPVGDMSLAHTHVDERCGRYREVTGPFRCDFVLTLHNNPGYIGAVYFGFQNADHGASDVVWDATGTSTPPVMQGTGTMENLTWSGHFTAHPELVGAWHGWTAPLVSVYTYFPNGDLTSVTVMDPVYSLVDPSQHEGWEPPQMSAGTSASSAATGQAYQNQFVFIVDYLPLLPIDAPWTVRISEYAYSSLAPNITTPPAEAEYRTDFNFHLGVMGTVRWSTLFNELDGLMFGNGVTITFDPAVLGPGSHRFGIINNQPNIGSQLATLLVNTLTVGPAVPPPPTAQPITLSVTSTVPSCVGTVNGMTLGGVVTVTSGSMLCQ